jgi:predicted transposase YdaD
VHHYVYQVTDDLHYQQFRATIHEEIPEAERVTMTIAEELMQKGRQEGRQEGRSSLLERQLTLKFGEIQAEHLQRLSTATAEQLVAYAERILTADSIEAVFAESTHRDPRSTPPDTEP